MFAQQVESAQGRELVAQVEEHELDQALRLPPRAGGALPLPPGHGAESGQGEDHDRHGSTDQPPLPVRPAARGADERCR